jgi:cation:H+ antiporter
MLRRSLPALLILTAILFYFSLFTTLANVFEIISIDAVSIIALVISSDVFVDEARSLSSRFRISSSSMGKFILGTGAVLDEIAVVLDSSLRGFGGISFGTIEGSNILTLAILIILIPLFVTGVSRKQTVGAMLVLVASSIVLPLAFLPVHYTLIFAPFLILIFLLYVLTGNSQHTPAENEKIQRFSIPVMALSVLLLALSSNALVIYTDRISAISGISSFASGFIVTGIAGSLPEITMFITSIRKVDGQAAMGVVIGSTIYKGTFLLAISMLITRIYFHTGLQAMLFMLPASFMLIFLSSVRSRKYYSFILGALMIISAFLLY